MAKTIQTNSNGKNLRNVLVVDVEKLVEQVASEFGSCFHHRNSIELPLIARDQSKGRGPERVLTTHFPSWSRVTLGTFSVHLYFLLNWNGFAWNGWKRRKGLALFHLVLHDDDCT